jgi:hypothetical protein
MPEMTITVHHCPAVPLWVQTRVEDEVAADAVRDEVKDPRGLDSVAGNDVDRGSDANNRFPQPSDCAASSPFDAVSHRRPGGMPNRDREFKLFYAPGAAAGFPRSCR